MSNRDESGTAVDESCFCVPLRDSSASAPPNLSCASFVSAERVADAVPPSLEFRMRATMVNAIASAHSSPGYPFFAAARPSRDVFGAFVDLRTPQLQSLTLPPAETVVAPSPSAADAPRDSLAAGPLLRVLWRVDRSRLAAAQALKPSQHSSAPRTPERSQAAPQLQRHPDGIQSVTSSPRLAEVLQHSAAIGDTASANACASANGSDVAEEMGCGDASVLLTLVTALSYSHLTVYAVRHQEGRVLSASPLQTLDVPVQTRKVTAQCPFLLSAVVDETYGAASARPQATPSGAQLCANKSTAKATAQTTAASTDDTVLYFERVEHKVKTHDKDTIQKECDAVLAVTLHMAVEPLILLGNEAGHILLFSLLDERVVQRLNYSTNTGVAASSVSSLPSSSSSFAASFAANNAPKRIVSSAVSAIAEIECGAERRLAAVMDRLRVGHRHDDTFVTIPAATVSSLFAVGFENGHVLIVSAARDGALITRHLSSFGDRPVCAIAPQTPHFFARVWSAVHCITNARDTMRITTDTFAGLDECDTDSSESARMAAVLCGGGSLCIVRVPSMELVTQVHVLDSHAVGDFLAVQWFPSTAATLRRPDLLLASNEDDTMALYQLIARPSPGWRQPPQAVEGSESVFTSSEQESARGAFVFVARRRFHRSWVNDLCALPLFLRRHSGSHTHCNRTSPRNVGHVLVATSYDGRTSFWPVGVGSSVDRLQSPGAAQCNELSLSSGRVECAGPDAGLPAVPLLRLPRTVPAAYIPLQPAAALPLHKEHTIRCVVGGAGDSYFLTSLCLRGRLKFWQVRLCEGNS